VAACVARASVSAQVVAGRVTERHTATAVSGVVISLVDADGRTVATVLADAQGAFEIKAPAGGRFAIDAKRIGVARTRSDFFDIAVGERREQQIVVDQIVPRLSVITTRQTRSCVRRPEQDAETLRLWEDARAALTATSITRRGGVTGTISKFMREVDLEDGEVLKYEVVDDVGDVTRAFRSVPAEQLGAEGYVVKTDEYFTYYAPDADVLLSDEFASRHCFHVVSRVVGGDTLVGLGFEPTRGSRGTDITGALWMNARTSELRDVSFVYRGLVQTKDRPEFGGVVHFLRLESGGWIVDDWVVRMPLIVVEADNSMTGSRRRPLTGRLGGVHEVGGMVRPDRVTVPPRAVLRGVVTDSAGTPMRGVMVALRPTPFAARTDSLGEFAFTRVRPGRYGVSLRSPELDSLNASVRFPTVELPDSVAHQLRFPSRAELAASLCGDDTRLTERAVVRVFVIDSATGKPLRGERIRVRWHSYTARQAANTSADRVQVNTTEVYATLDDDGAFLGCRLPGDQAIEIESSAGPTVWKDTVQTRAGEVAWRVRRVHAP